MIFHCTDNATYCLSVHLLNTWVISASWLPYNATVSMGVHTHVGSIPCFYFPDVEILGHMVILIEFCMLNHPCMPGINSTWSWCKILLMVTLSNFAECAWCAAINLTGNLWILFLLLAVTLLLLIHYGTCMVPNSNWYRIIEKKIWSSRLQRRESSIISIW